MDRKRYIRKPAQARNKGCRLQIVSKPLVMMIGEHFQQTFDDCICFANDLLVTIFSPTGTNAAPRTYRFVRCPADPWLVSLFTYFCASYDFFQLTLKICFELLVKAESNVIDCLYYEIKLFVMLNFQTCIVYQLCTMAAL